eukprot:CAMPEP_0174853332 /NCGR_PEP_ID=MMETSP1114-20130205/27977_1 /TAXON_ID=312471 /ORGANISM="Neobodo designis, Strain CCAP 1951/1" /LENGTH=350 /DNA_ID=CAMNT_0016087967 /DNA_START=102 /DNA_END=1154 /DNA_ORIENTATION=-
MWASLTQTFAKDLGEFATVLTRDTQRIVEGDDATGDGLGVAPGADTGGVVAGDEATPEGALFRITQEELEWLQSEVATFAAPLLTEEEETASRLSWEGRDGDALLDANETVRDQYAYLVTQRASAPAATPKTAKIPAFMSPDAAPSPTHDGDQAPAATAPGSDATPERPSATSDRALTKEEFFRRYFTRLLIFRRKCSADRRRRGQSLPGRTDDEANPQPENEDWDAEEEPAAAAAHGGAEQSRSRAGGAASQLSDAERAQYTRRIAELEGLVKALGAQVGHLQEENGRLAEQLRQSQSCAGSPPRATGDTSALSPAPTAPAAATATTPAAGRGTSSQMAIDDDDWATLS